MACRETAPGLVQAYHKFKARGVAFVSLTDTGRGGAEAFVNLFGVPWPCGYGARLEDLARLGAYSPERTSGDYNPGQEVSPTLYLIGPDGRVVWHDDQARPRHRATPQAVVEELEAAIQAELVPPSVVKGSAARPPAAGRSLPG